ncbi:MAG TPA: MFS transporter, partial [Terriglobia bacterium]|nr:MFS transporter [Terriglobia bacterium]
MERPRRLGRTDGASGKHLRSDSGGPGLMKSSRPSLRWLMVALAFFATAINYLDRQSLSVTAPVLMDKFHMSNETYAQVIFAFMLAYTIANGISGPALDRLGTRLGFALTMAWWSAADMLHALARGPWSLGAYRFLLGIGEAGNWPASVKVVAEWFPVNERALASGIFNSGSSVGAILAPPVVVWLLLHYGWRQVFVWLGAAGCLWLLVWSLVYQTPEGVRQEVARPRISAWKLFRTRFVWSFTLSKVFMDPVWYFYIFWFPEYLESARHFSMASIGKYAWIPFAVAGLGNILGGWLSAFMLRRGVSLNMTRKGGVTVFAILMTSAIPAALVESVGVSITLVSLAMLGYTGCCSILLAFPADVFPKNVVGSIWGLASMGSGFGGMIFALLTGAVIDRFSYVPVFVAFGLMPLICAAILWTLLGPIPRAPAVME